MPNRSRSLLTGPRSAWLGSSAPVGQAEDVAPGRVVQVGAAGGGGPPKLRVDGSSNQDQGLALEARRVRRRRDVGQGAPDDRLVLPAHPVKDRGRRVRRVP